MEPALSQATARAIDNTPAYPLPPRLLGAIVLIAAAAWLGVALSLTPDARGLGTHQQLGLAACGFHEHTGHPCPTCGMTTAFTLAAHGRLLDALVTQPLAALLALAVAMAAVAGAWAAATGAWLGPAFYALGQARFWWIIAALTLAAWLYKLMGAPV